MQDKLLKQRLAELTGTHARDWFLLFRGRSAMQVVFSTLAEVFPQRPAIATQAFTCVSAINPILDSGLRPKYYDISPQHYAIDSAKLGREDLADCSALAMQHTFGIFSAANAQRLQKLARQERLLLVEDSAHALGRMLEQAGEKLADVSIHSFGSEKLLPTKHGAAIWVNPRLQATPFGQRLIAALEAVPPAPAQLSQATAKYLWQIRFLAHLPAFAARILRQHWLRRGKFYPPIMLPQETSGTGTPYPPYQMPAPAVARALELLKDYETMMERRAENCAIFTKELKAHLALPQELLSQPRTPLLRFPFQHPQAEELIKYLRAQGFKGIGSWYRPALFPGVEAQAEKYYYDPALRALPETKKAVQTIVNLPTDLSPETTRELAAAILRYLTK